MKKVGAILFILLFSTLISLSQVYISGRIFNANHIGIYGNVNLSETELLNNSGHLSINNSNSSNYIDINNSTIEGTLSILGTKQTNININNHLSLGTLELDKPGAESTFLSGDSLLIKNNLVLTKGVLTNTDAKLKIENNSTDCVKYNEQAYVIGNLQRRISKGATYCLPVGDNEHLHLIRVHNTGTDNNLINCCFCIGLPNNLKSGSLQLSDHGFWDITSETRTTCELITFYNSMDLFNESNLSVLQILEDENSGQEEVIISTIDYNTENQNFTISAILNKLPSQFIIVDNPEEQMEEWINFISLSNGSDTHYIIPQLNTQYLDVSISIFNNWGNKIYDSKNYKNEFNAIDYPEGTYYYLASYNARNSSKRFTKTGFFEVIN